MLLASFTSHDKSIEVHASMDKQESVLLFTKSWSFEDDNKELDNLINLAKLKMSLTNQVVSLNSKITENQDLFDCYENKCHVLLKESALSNIFTLRKDCTLKGELYVKYDKYYHLAEMKLTIDSNLLLPKCQFSSLDFGNVLFSESLPMDKNLKFLDLDDVF